MFSPPQKLLEYPVLRRLLPSLWKKYMRLVKSPFFVEKRMGLIHLIDQSNSIDRNLVIKGTWEKQQIGYFANQINKLKKSGRSVEFWDIGAHAGLYSIYLAKHCGLDILHAFEPDPRNHAQLCANLFLNDMTQTITVHKLAVADVEEDISFYIATAGNRGGSRIGIEGDADLIGETIVKAVRLDNHLKPKSDILALKVDVESHEKRVFDGMPEILKTAKIFLQLEIFEDNQATMISYLEEKGFKLMNTVDFDHYFCNFEMDPVRNDT